MLDTAIGYVTRTKNKLHTSLHERKRGEKVFSIINFSIVTPIGKKLRTPFHNKHCLSFDDAHLKLS